MILEKSNFLMQFSLFSVMFCHVSRKQRLALWPEGSSPRVISVPFLLIIISLLNTVVTKMFSVGFQLLGFCHHPSPL